VFYQLDTIFNTSHFGLLIRGLETGNPDWLAAALTDRIHQPYRQRLIPGYTDVERAVIAAGGYGMVISGAGPTLLALTSSERAADVAIAMSDAWGIHKIEVRAQSLEIDMTGAKVRSQVKI
jgi:homoserine kinase